MNVALLTKHRCPGLVTHQLIYCLIDESSRVLLLQVEFPQGLRQELCPNARRGKHQKSTLSYLQLRVYKQTCWLALFALNRSAAARYSLCCSAELNSHSTTQLSILLCTPHFSLCKVYNAALGRHASYNQARIQIILQRCTMSVGLLDCLLALQPQDCTLKLAII